MGILFHDLFCSSSINEDGVHGGYPKMQKTIVKAIWSRIHPMILNLEDFNWNDISDTIDNTICIVLFTNQHAHQYFGVHLVKICLNSLQIKSVFIEVNVSVFIDQLIKTLMV